MDKDAEKAVGMLHGTYWSANRAWALFKRFTELEDGLTGFWELKNALRDSLAQTAVLETWKLYDRDPRSGSIPTVVSRLRRTSPSLKLPLVDTDEPMTRDALQEVGKARNKIMAHANFRTIAASMNGITRLLEVAEPFIMATKEALGQPSKVLGKGSSLAPFYEFGTLEAVEQLKLLIDYAQRGRS